MSGPATDPHGSALQRILAAARRRRVLAAGVFLMTAAGLGALAIGLPPVYRATTTLIVGSAVPETFVRSAVSPDVSARLQTVRREVLTREHLSELVERFDLYAELRAGGDEAALRRVLPLVERDTSVSLLEAPGANGQPTAVAIELGYVHPDPLVAADVVNALAELYVTTNERVTQAQATRTTEFLRARLDEVSARLDAERQQVELYSTRTRADLPQQLQANLASMQRLSSELQLNATRQMQLRQRRQELSDRLLGLDAVESPSVMAQESPREQLVRLERELRLTRTRLNDQHPDVTRLQAEVDRLRDVVALEAEDAVEAGAGEQSPREAIEASIVEIDAELQTLGAADRALHAEMTEYEQRIQQAPVRETEFAAVTRDYQAARDLYTSLEQRYEEARMAERLEDGGAGLRVLERAAPPIAPSTPGRLPLLALGLAVALACAVAAVVLREATDTSFSSIDDLRAFTAVPVLASIPVITTRGERWGARARLGLAAGVLLVAAVAVASGVLDYARELDEISRLLVRG